MIRIFKERLENNNQQFTVSNVFEHPLLEGKEDATIGELQRDSNAVIEFLFVLPGHDLKNKEIHVEPGFTTQEIENGANAGSELVEQIIERLVSSHDAKAYLNSDLPQATESHLQEALEVVKQNFPNLAYSDHEEFVDELRSALHSIHESWGNSDPYDDVAEAFLKSNTGVARSLSYLSDMACVLESFSPSLSSQVREALEDVALTVTSRELFLADSTSFDENLKSKYDDYSVEQLEAAGLIEYTPEQEFSM